MKADDRFDPDWVAALPPHSVMVAPTMAHGEPVGGLFLVWWRTGRVFLPDEIRLVEGVAAQVGLAMENAELARQTQSKLAETETLLSVSRAVSSTFDLQSLVRHFMRQVATTFEADTVGLWLVDETGRWLTPLAGYHVPPAQLEMLRGVRLSIPDHPIFAQAASTLRPVVSHDAVQRSAAAARTARGRATPQPPVGARRRQGPDDRRLRRGVVDAAARVLGQRSGPDRGHRHPGRRGHRERAAVRGEPAAGGGAVGPARAVAGRHRSARPRRVARRAARADRARARRPQHGRPAAGGGLRRDGGRAADRRRRDRHERAATVPGDRRRPHDGRAGDGRAAAGGRLPGGVHAARRRSRSSGRSGYATGSACR